MDEKQRQVYRNQLEQLGVPSDLLPDDFFNDKSDKLTDDELRKQIADLVMSETLADQIISLIKGNKYA